MYFPAVLFLCQRLSKAQPMGTEQILCFHFPNQAACEHVSSMLQSDSQIRIYLPPVGVQSIKNGNDLTL